MSTSNEKTVIEEINFIKSVASRYKTLRTLYPDEKLSFKDLARLSGVDEANLSRQLKKLKEDGLVKIEKITENVSRSYSLISLPYDVKRIIKTVIDLIGSLERPALKAESKHLEDALPLLWNKDIQELTGDHIQIISRNTKVPPTSELFAFIGEHLLDEVLDPVRPVILLSLKSVLQNSNYEERQIIGEKIAPTIQTISNMFPTERSGKLAKQILDEYYLDDLSYETLSEEYVKRVICGSNYVNNIRDRLLQRFPEMKIDLRALLLHEYSGAESDVQKRIESELLLLF
ncbi:winged helix-turn-helix domain-containing protein [Thermoproteota archaeon]